MHVQNVITLKLKNEVIRRINTVYAGVLSRADHWSFRTKQDLVELLFGVLPTPEVPCSPHVERVGRVRDGRVRPGFRRSKVRDFGILSRSFVS